MTFDKKQMRLLHYRHVLPSKWSAYLRANFENSVGVAFFFGVDEKTARNWLDCTSAPRAEAVLALAEHDPSVIAYLLSEGAE